MTKLPKRNVAHFTDRAAARRVDNGLSLSHQADPVEVIIDQNLSESMDYKLIDADNAWSDFMKKVS